MYPMYNKSLDDWKEIEQLLLAYRVAHPGYPASEAEYPTLAHFIFEVRKASYNMGVARGQSDNLAHEKHQREGYAQGLDAGRALGFAAGFAAAQQQPQAKIEAAYEQGKADAAKLVLLRKNGVGY